MSGRSGASGSMRSAAGSVRLSAGAGAAHEVVLDALYERKRDKKTVRVLTVVVYVFCVSLAAIMLSLYYVFFWEPKEAHYAQRKVSHTVASRAQTSTTPMPTCLLPHTGGSDTPVNETATPPTFDSITNFTNSNETSETVVDFAESPTSISTEEDYTLNDNETLDVTTVT